MNRVWIAIGIGILALLAGCGTTGGGTQQPKAAVEQRDVVDQPPPDAAAVEAQRAAEAEARRRAEEEARRNAEAARQAEAEARRRDEPVVQPLPDARVAERTLSDPASMLKDPGSLLSKRSVYYDFDMYSIREEFQPMIEAHAKFLRDHKDMRVRVEGNCDERGSREYNLALGQRRADAVKRAMVLLGVQARQIETVSFGAEKPRVEGSNEEAWAENRRSDIVYVGLE
jgi:peptidoglycan-associated lipoprotein